MGDFIPIWTQAITQSPLGGRLFGKNKTAAFNIRVPVEACGLRLRFSNLYGKAPYRFGACVLAFGETVCPVTLDGKSSFEIPIGGDVTTDALPLRLPRGTEVQIRLFYTSFITDGNAIEEEATLLPGDQTRTDGFAEGVLQSALLRKAGVYNAIPSLSAVEILTDEDVKAIVAFGDSITAMSQWTKPLAERLNERYGGKAVLLNAGISGNCLLYERPDFMGPIFGEKGTDRFARDVLRVPRLHTVIFGLGVNDVAYFTEKTKEIINLTAYRNAVTKIAETLHEKGVKVCMQTITPRIGCARIMGKYTKEMEELRLALNSWIRSAGIFDSVFDADALVREETPEGFVYKDGLHRGDRLHPNKTGGRLLADAFDLEELI